MHSPERTSFIVVREHSDGAFRQAVQVRLDWRFNREGQELLAIARDQSHKTVGHAIEACRKRVSG